jgi:hypothetical protein
MSTHVTCSRHNDKAEIHVFPLILSIPNFSTYLSLYCHIWTSTLTPFLFNFCKKKIVLLTYMYLPNFFKEC